MNQHLQAILNFIQQAEHLSDDEKTALLKAAKAADKELEITAFKLERTEKEKHSTAVLLEETIEELEQKRKAVEAQNKELEIEAALEKVRSRSLAMHKSDELWEVVAVVFEKLQELNFAIDGAAFIITFIKGSTDSNVWLADDHGQLYPSSLRLPYYDTPSIKDTWLAKESGLDFFSKTYSFEEKNHWFSYAFVHTDLKILSDDLKNWILEQPCLTQSCAFGKNSMIGIHFHHQKTLSDTEGDILKRFSKVFDQAYIRFLDLQKAEAQAKEAQIEAALERIRAGAMAMQSSDELIEVSHILREQMGLLGQRDLETSVVSLYDEGSNQIHAWHAFRLPDTSGKIITGAIAFSKDSCSLTKEMMVGYSSGKKEYTVKASEQAMREFLNVLVTADPNIAPHLGGVPEITYHHFTYFTNGALITVSYQPPSDETKSLQRRAASVFDLAYRRYLDLKRAEAQTREAQIELGLERVRARAMAMQSSIELSELVDTVFKELTKLDFALKWCIINIIDENSMSNTVWAANPDIDKAPESYYMKFEDYPFHHAMMKGWKERKTKYVYTLEGLEKKVYDDYLFGETEFRRTPEAAQAASRAMEKYVVSFSFSNFGGLQTVGDAPLSDANLDILSRFGKVFDLTYTRFNDLKQAEAQARESQIQLALERVRARTMSMQRSEELGETASLLFKQVSELGIRTFSCGFQIWQENDQYTTAYMSPDGIIRSSFRLPLTEQRYFKKIYDARQRGEDLFAMETAGKELEDMFKYLFTVPGFMNGGEDLESFWLNQAPFQINHSAFFSHGFLSFITPQTVPDAQNIFKRFAKVFEQAYTRFLDLQKAEAQAREAQIQLALERVRARTMAMQKSDELSETSYVLFQQFRELGEGGDQISIGIFDEDEKGMKLYSTFRGSQWNRPASIEFNKHRIYQNIYSGWKDQKRSLVTELAGKELQDLNKIKLENPDYQVSADELAQEHWTVCAAFFSNGVLSYASHESPAKASIQLLERFASVFDLTYTRFLDLQKAEAQARESQIQLALERIRARTMGMQKSDELTEAALLLFDQLQSLGSTLWSCGFNIWEKGAMETTAFITRGGKMLEPVRLSFSGDPFLRLMDESREKDEELHVTELSGDSIFRYVAKQRQLQSGNVTFLSEVTLPSRQIVHLVNFSHGNLMFISLEACPEMHDVFKRFGKVFDQTYTRFLDLQNAEAQARENQIQLALERVRARTMAMQKSDELTAAADLLFQQVQVLGVSSWNCGFHIWDEDKRGGTAWMGTRQGLLRSFKTTGSEDVFLRFYEAAERGETLYVEEMSGETLAAHNRYMARLPVVGEVVKAVAASPAGLPTFLIFHVAYFSQGYLIFITRQPCVEMHDTFTRFAKVFDQTYTRFLDLQKAEAQAREAQIEAALEKVRSRSLAMHRADELKDVIAVLREKLRELGIAMESRTVLLITLKKGSKDFTQWVARPDVQFTGSTPLYVETPYFDHPILIDFWNAKERGSNFLAKTYTPEEKNSFFKFIFENTASGNASEDEKNWILKTGYYAVSAAIENNSAIVISNFSDKLLSEGENEILKRFARVFEQAYIRFLDLQKAEEQTKEAQIEAALEKVRSRSMGMQKSEELKEVIHVVYEQFVHLSILVEHAGFIMDYKERDDMHIWLADQHEVPFQVTIPYFDCAHWNSFIEAKEKGKDFFANHLSFEEKNKFYQDLFKLVPAPDEAKEYYLNCPGLAISTVLLDNVGLYIENFSGIPYTDEVNKTLMRFGKVFQQTYTRFLDLQKAEAQAREAKIEAALEKVRSRSLAMHKSDELQEVVHTVLEKLKELNVDFYTVVIVVFQENSKDVVWWLENKEQQQYPRILLHYSDNPYLRDLLEARESSMELFSKCYSFEEKNELFNYLFNDTDFKNVPEDQKKFLLETEFSTISVAVEKKTGLHITSYSRRSFSEEEHEILKRFAKVFDQAYTRFLDLQKAEAQAREAQIEAALERVRSRTTGMRKSEELRDVIQMVFEQLQHLDFNIDSAHFNLNYKESDDYNLWSAAPGQPYPVKTYIPYFDHPVFIKARQAKEKGLDFFTESYTHDEKNKFFEHLFRHTPLIPEERRKYILSCRGVAASTVVMNSISLWIMNYAGIPYSEVENAILKRFGKVFEQAYIRFNDLKQAEEQALEVIKRASVDRVRAEIASMRTTKDLERITPLIWNELKTLGVPFIRCGVFIMDEEHQQVQTHLSTPDGEALATFNLPYDAPGETAQILAHWHKKELYKQHWNEAQFIGFTQNLVQQGAVTSGEKYLIENRPTDLYLHFLPFLQGMLYAGNTSPLNNDELQLMQNLADAFSTAYARYEDFNKLEAAKKLVDSALNELQATQKQLIQSEKMASLGELTAGIAHEIQNPLNFVNNFSDVNAELISELVDEVDKGNYDEVKVIAVSIKDNEEKIKSHGRRADSIVKSMMQHSRVSTGQKEPTDINALCDEYLRLSYHGFRAKEKNFNAILNTDFDNTIGKINIVPQDIGRVLLNLYNNAFYAVSTKALATVDAVSSKLAAHRSQLPSYVPTITIVTKKMTDKIEITVKDNGPGIPQNIIDKIFQPFFTTKPTGQGTGLGLSLSYDIIKAHGGEIKVETKKESGSDFIVQLPNT